MNNKLLEKNHLKQEDFEPKSDDTKEVLERIEAQTTYTAIMTDTLVEEET